MIIYGDDELIGAINRAEATLGFKILMDDATEVLQHTARKMKLIGKAPSYIGLLFENELTDFYLRRAITAHATGKVV